MYGAAWAKIFLVCARWCDDDVIFLRVVSRNGAASQGVSSVVVGHDPKCSMGGPTDQSRHSIFYRSFLRECPRVVIDILLQAFPQDVMHFLPRE